MTGWPESKVGKNFRDMKCIFFTLLHQGGMVGIKGKDKEGGFGKKGGKRGDKDDDEGQILDLSIEETTILCRD